MAKLPRNRTNPTRVAVIGSGLAGISAAVNLKRAGITDFTVFEQSAGPGGVWWDNTYPGCEVDTDSIGYSYPFLTYEWTRTHGTQPQLQRYTADVIDAFGLRDHFRFSNRVEEAVWDNVAGLFRVQLSSGETHDFEVVVSAVGMLNVPAYPDWPGMGTFEGVMFHSARWRHDVDLSGKRVAVVGSGCTAAQIIPKLAEYTGELTLFQREPGWVLPKDDREFTPKERAHLRRGGLRMRLKRYKAYFEVQRYLTAFTVGSRKHAQLEQRCLDLINSQVESAELRELVTPAYPYGCKRPIKSSTYYPALNRPNVHLVPQAVSAATSKGLVDASGKHHEFDVVVLAVGFKAADYLASLRVVGPDGVAVRDAWDGNPRAYLGMTVSGVPNFFMMYGPNTNGGGPTTAMFQQQAELIAHLCHRMTNSRVKLVVTTPATTMHRFVRWVDKSNKYKWSTLSLGCNNYYFSPSGRNATQWPMTLIRYGIMTKLASRIGLRLVPAASQGLSQPQKPARAT